MPRAVVSLLLLPCLALGCRPALPPSPPDVEPAWFSDVTAAVGLDFVHDAGPLPGGRYFMPQIMGSGAALFDYDNDGRLDIYLIHNGGPNGPKNRLFHQEKDGRFTDASAGSGLDVAGFGMGAAVGDVNNDGRPDLLLTEYGGTRLFLNNGGGRFSDITKEAGIDNPLWGTSAAFVDYDRDGWLDLVVVNYVDYDPTTPCGDSGGRIDYCHPGVFPGAVTKLYRNQGSGVRGQGSETKPQAVRFEDATIMSGLGRRPGPGLGVLCADFTGDRWPDIFVANDSKPNHLWVNQRDGTFREEAVVRGVALNALGQAQANMGIALGDVDGDGLLDLFVTHLSGESHTLWKQGPRGQFTDRTAPHGLGMLRGHGTGFGTLLADFDHDGAPDLAVVNGHVTRAGGAARGTDFWGQYAGPSQLFANDGAGRFRDISPSNAAYCGAPAITRGLASGDVDGDGALDLLTSAAAGPARLFRNTAPRRGHWLSVRAVDPALGGRDAYGAEITVRAGGRTWLGLINPGQSYLCSCAPAAHFGLGPAKRVDGVRVVWPDGTEEAFPGRPADRAVVLRKGDGKK